MLSLIKEGKEELFSKRQKPITMNAKAQGPVVRSLVSANRWLRGIKTYGFPWCLTLVSANQCFEQPGPGGYLLVDEYVSDDFASGCEDDKRLREGTAVNQTRRQKGQLRN